MFSSMFGTISDGSKEKAAAQSLAAFSLPVPVAITKVETISLTVV